MLRGTVSIALAASLLCLSGCAAEPAVTTPAPVPSTTTSAPVFASKEEALAAAEKVYRRYLEVGEKLRLNPANANVHAFDGLVTADQEQVESRTFKSAAKSGLRARGAVKLEVFREQRVDLNAGAVTAYVCVNQASARILNSAGEDITPSSRPSTRSAVATFKLSDRQLLFAGQQSYDGERLC